MIKKHHFTIAIFSSSNKSPFDGLIKGFVSHLKKYAAFEFEIVECITNFDREKAYEWADYLAKSNVNLIYAIGQNNTEAIYHNMKHLLDQKPVVAGGVPIECCETPPEVIQNAMLFTATTGSFNWHQKIELLKKALPYSKKVLVLFRSIDELSHTNLREKNSITAALRKYHLSWEMHHINNLENITHELSPQLLHDIDLVIISRTGSLMNYTRQISQHCQKYNAPVFSTDIISSDTFLSIAECTERKFGQSCAQQVIQILDDKKNASEISIRQLVGPHEAVVRPQNAQALITTTAIGNLTAHATHVKLSLKQL